jgi:hypothetical protein
MAELKQYDPSKPWISINLPTKEELIAATLGLIPGYRALKNMYDNPEGPIFETLDLAAEDLVPLYGSLIKPAINGDDIDAEQALKEAAILGTPVKSRKKGRMSTRGRVNATADARTPADVPAGPYRETNTGSNLVNQGQQMTNTNTVSTTRGNNVTGANAWQGDMYPPGRSLSRLEEYGPYVWDKATDQREYIRKLNDIINENENKWEYLINKTRSKAPEGSPKVQRRAIVPKEDIVSIALAQGRPDIAARVMADNDIRVNYTNSSNPSFNPRFRSYNNAQGSYPMFKDNAVWKDYGNRQVEKELREQFAMLPEDDLMRYKFADYYGVPDLYNDWKANPEYWKEFRDKTNAARLMRETTNKWWDIKYERQLEE